MKTKKKMMSLLLAVCMVLTLMPTTALAEESTVDNMGWFRRYKLVYRARVGCRIPYYDSGAARRTGTVGQR